MSKLKAIHECLIAQGKTLALAESCSGGNLSAQFVAMPDASKYLLGSLVTYANAMKKNVLNVSDNTLTQYGAVSRETAHEMWIGLMKLSDADFGIATTGIAGPTGGTEDKPVGTVFIAIGTKGEKPRIFENHFSGDREKIIQATTEEAIKQLYGLLKNA
jgi:PncC family amidohydrolase